HVHLSTNHLGQPSSYNMRLPILSLLFLTFFVAAVTSVNVIFQCENNEACMTQMLANLNNNTLISYESSYFNNIATKSHSQFALAIFAIAMTLFFKQ
ncbi:hypothetical protein BDF19DRAFT_438145, partial [Syncephalis fuscata]